MTAYRFNPQAMRIVRQLKQRHGLDSDGEVILRALALLDAADEVVSVDGVVTIQAAQAGGSGASISDRKDVRLWRREEMLEHTVA